jgi:ABC-type hemin transport system substrate-binding protein
MSEKTELSENQESKGLGDTIAKITNAVGLDKVAESIAKSVGKEDCGCNKRRQKLNDMFPYKNG